MLNFSFIQEDPRLHFLCGTIYPYLSISHIPYPIQFSSFLLFSEQDFYLMLRRQYRGPDSTPVTTRQLESLIRLTEVNLPPSPKLRRVSDLVNLVGELNRAETAYTFAKARNFKPRYLPATDPKIRQHLIFCALGLKLWTYRFKKLIHPNTSLSQIAR